MAAACGGVFDLLIQVIVIYREKIVIGFLTVFL